MTNHTDRRGHNAVKGKQGFQEIAKGEPANVTLTRRTTGVPEDDEHGVAGYVPRDGDLADYYASTDKKHFSDLDSPGSKFTDPDLSRLEDVLELAAGQRGSLDGDDRDALISLGADADAFNDMARYLLVHTPGRLGAQKMDSLPADARIFARRTKAGGKVSLVAEVSQQADTGFATIIIGPDKQGTRDIVWTAHPGLPATSGGGEDTFGDHDGQELTRDQIAAIAGTRNVTVNTMPTA